MRKLLVVFLACPFLGGCFQVAQFFRDMAVTGDPVAEAVHVVDYRYIGVGGPLSLWVENSRGVRADVAFDDLRAPSLSDRAYLDLETKDISRIEEESRTLLRDYFGGAKTAQFVILVRAGKEERKEFLVDARNPERTETAAELLVRRGLCLVDRGMLRAAKLQRLLALQEDAQRERLGVWKHLSQPNPDYP